MSTPLHATTSLARVGSSSTDDDIKSPVSPTPDDAALKEDKDDLNSPVQLVAAADGEEQTVLKGAYRTYKRRWLGCVPLVLFNIVCAMNWVLFSTIATQTSQHFSISLTQVNWLANIVCATYLFAAPSVPFLVSRFTIRGTCWIAAGCLLIGSWLRYAATASSLSAGGAYALLFLGSTLVGIGQCLFQIVPPAFSEAWFGLNLRTSITMIVAVSNPFGGAIASLLAPSIVPSVPVGSLLSATMRYPELNTLLLIIAAVTTAITPLTLLIGAKPPTPPTASAAARVESAGEKSGGYQTLLVLLGLRMSAYDLGARRKVDFWLIAVIFSVILGFFDAFLTMTSQLMEPVGYDSDTAGFVGAATIVSGIVAAVISAPLLDRYFHFRLALAAKLLVPLIGIAFLALPFSIRAHSTPSLYFLAVLLGVASFIMLPVALELAAEVVWGVEGAGAEWTSAVLYWGGNGFSVVTVTVMNALRAPATANPPLNMHKALLFEGIFVAVVSVAVFGLQGRQRRKECDFAATAKESAGREEA